ncbi:hypothetical protein BGZ58_002145 [Dissophora ornata]|nr:hypothetical protein BGZ58_002145 [Dissophora ornata]
MYGVVGEAIANVANTTYEKVVEDRIFKPLGLSSTGFTDGKQVLNKESIGQTLSAYTFNVRSRRTADFAPFGLGWLVDSYKGQIVYTHAATGPIWPSSRMRILWLPHLANVKVTELTTFLPLYIVDELLDLPRTLDWINGTSIEATQNTYALFDGFAQGVGIPERAFQTSQSNTGWTLL